MEIERRFLVKDISTLNLSSYKHKEIIQDYLYKDKFTTIRKRKIISNDKDITYLYTIKTGRINISVNEMEREITEKQYDDLTNNPNNVTIHKTRYMIPYKENLTIELDVFHGVYEGIIFAEIEFESEQQAFNIELPEWFSKDISDKISNSSMALKYKKSFLKLKEM